MKGRIYSKLPPKNRIFTQIKRKDGKTPQQNDLAEVETGRSAPKN
jgi:hypothetical protein